MLSPEHTSETEPRTRRANKLIADVALAWHLTTGSSDAFVTLHISGFLAGYNGDAAATSPFYLQPPSTTIHLHAWETARLAGKAYAAIPVKTENAVSLEITPPYEQTSFLS
jgi:hypothetical protein